MFAVQYLYILLFFFFNLNEKFTYISLLKFVDIVFTHKHQTLPCVAKVTEYTEEDAGIGAAAADVSSADCDTILEH